jgi:hypothetical protein
LAKFPPHAEIFNKLATRKADCIPLWEATKFKPSIAISLNLQAIQVWIIQKENCIFCQFHFKKCNSIALQKWIGFADVQSLPTIFYVQKNGAFSIKNVPIPYEISVTNIGGAMDEKKGIFTAPRNGVYFFGFSGIGTFNSTWGWLDVSLMKNGNMVGVAECNSGTAGNWETLSFQLTIQLKAGDQVWTQITEINNAVLHEDGRHFVHFNGYMLQEELSP